MYFQRNRKERKKKKNIIAGRKMKVNPTKNRTHPSKIPSTVSFVCFRVRFNQLYRPVQSFIIFIICIILLLPSLLNPFRIVCTLSLKYQMKNPMVTTPSTPDHFHDDDFRKQIVHFLCLQQLALPDKLIHTLVFSDKIGNML